MFLDHCKLKILKKMLVTPHGYKGNAPKIGPFDIIPGVILSGKDKTSVEVAKFLLTIFVHNYTTTSMASSSLVAQDICNLSLSIRIKARSRSFYSLTRILYK